MDQVLKELTLYDLTGYLVPGVIIVWAASMVMHSARRRADTHHPELKLLTFILIAYLAGHMIQAVATPLERHVFRPLFWKSMPAQFADDKAFVARLEAAANRAFGPIADDSRRFLLCQTYIQVRRLDAYIAVMQARYAFFKGLTLAFLLATLAFAGDAVVEHRQRGRRKLARQPMHRDSRALAVAMLLASILSFVRLTEFEHHYADSVYRTFYVAEKLATQP